MTFMQDILLFCFYCLMVKYNFSVHAPDFCVDMWCIYIEPGYGTTPPQTVPFLAATSKIEAPNQMVFR